MPITDRPEDFIRGVAADRRDANDLAGRLPPQNLDMEMAVLGSMLIKRDAIDIAAEILRSEDFYRETNRIIFDAILALWARNEPVDLLTLQEELIRMPNSNGQGGVNQLEAVGGIPYLTSLMDAVPTVTHVEHYAKIVTDKATLRRLIDASNQIHGIAYSDFDSVDIAVDEAEQIIFDVGKRRRESYFTPIRVLMNSVYDKIEYRAEHKDAETGLETPFHDLNFMTAGLQPSDLIIVAARPSMGKTALCLSLAQYAAMKKNTTTAIFSLEMSKEQVGMRLICSEARVDAHRLRTGYIPDNDWTKVGAAVARLAEAPIFIDDSTDASALEIRSKCRRLKATPQGLGLVIIDYLQLMRGHRRTENRTQEISEIARSLKSLARELALPVVALSQLSRAVEQRENKRPMLSDLRESGSIEAEADVVIFIYRESYYKMREAINDEEADLDKQKEYPVEKTELIIAKQRNGPTGHVAVAFHQQYARFDNYEEGYEED
ncbi:MAG: replicative DNA helicase [Armatimonadetes bacterium]|nr:replicative DNA helicase [Armatimonadota bacterium]